LTGTTVVTRETEWNKYAQTSALAFVAHESRRCPTCRNWDALEPMPAETRHVTWAQHGGRVAEVVAFRCIYCGAADIIKRDFAEKQKDHKPVTGHASPGDGRMFAARPPTEEV
jgi:hypothetical protein